MRSILIEFTPCGNEEEMLDITLDGFASEDVFEVITHTLMQMKVNGYTLQHMGNLKRIK